MLARASALLLAASASLVSAQGTYGGSPSSTASSPYPSFTGDPFKEYTLSAKGINATFIPYGARLTKLFVQDNKAEYQDVVLGYDDPHQYLIDTETNHTYFGPIVGRYANRIKNGTFTINGVKSQIPENEHMGIDTLHGGVTGYDQQNWTVVSADANSITFSFYDNAQQGFPGDVLNLATYTLTDAPAWISRLVSIAINAPSPIMLANHNYWNLGAFVNTDALTVLNNTLYMPYADRIIDVDGILIPTGGINITNGTGYDFTEAPGHAIGRDIPTLVNSCGTGCSGYDNAFILDRPRNAQPDDPSVEVLRMSSPDTGIVLSLESNQQGLQIYTCEGQNGYIPVKASQQHFPGNVTHVEKFGCIVIETQDWIDGINHPEWGRGQYQIYSATSEPYVNYQKYTFSVAN